ncbi:hypothetical protein SAMN05660657_03938 [Geodermatophilus amargosae]|uniref:Uncharacterized protein n=1 Tax=Geodermatophilus amargosae TaxID=1296565 RepID=A0A1I7C0R1_9ACTN|nr:hypothetical protein SAMN05660657_03938 [Geodermatophilus amargosae]
MLQPRADRPRPEPVLDELIRHAMAAGTVEPSAVTPRLRGSCRLCRWTEN